MYNDFNPSKGNQILKLDLIIPAYNESERILPTLQEYIVELSQHDYHVIVVDDGSDDNTIDVVEQFANDHSANIVVAPLNTNKGKGAAVRHGLFRHRPDADIIFFADADGSTPADEFNALINAWKEGCDVAVASRGLGTIIDRQSWVRDRMGKTFNQILRCVLPTNIKDTQCGFKLFTPDVLKPILSLSTLDGFAFDVEFLIIAQENSYKITEVPISWFHKEESRVHIIKDSLRMLRDSFIINRKRVNGDYKQQA